VHKTHYCCGIPIDLRQATNTRRWADIGLRSATHSEGLLDKGDYSPYGDHGTKEYDAVEHRFQSLDFCSPTIVGIATIPREIR